MTQMGGTFDAVAVDGKTVYLGIGPRFATVDISDPASPRLLWQSDVLTDVVGAIAIQPGLAYLRVGTELLIYDVSDPALPALVGTLSGVSGGLVAAGDFVYTLAPSVAYQPLIAIDVSDPAHATLAARRELSATARIAVSGEVLFIVSGGRLFDKPDEGLLQLVDRANLERTFSQVTLESAWSYQVAVVGDIAYVVEIRLSGDPDALLVLDVSDPAHPREITRRQMGLGQEIIATDEALFLLWRTFPHSGCPAGLNIVPITDPASPQGPFEFHPQSCFNRFAVTGDTLVATSERGLQIFNASDPANVTLTGELAPPDGFITAERIALHQGLAYLLTTAGRNRLQRLRVLDVANATPTLLNGDGLDLGEPLPSILGGLDVRGNRLFGLGPTAVDISDPASPRLAAGDLGVDNTEGVFYWPTPALVENVLYTGLLTNTPDGLRIGGGFGIVDMSDPDNPILVNKVPMEGSAVVGLSATDRYLIVFSHKDFTRLQIFDVSDPLTPVEVGRLEPAVALPDQVAHVTVSGDTVYAAGGRDSKRNGFTYTIYALDISDPSHPGEIGRFEVPDHGILTKMVAAGDTTYMWLHGSGFWALNISDRSHPYVSGQFPLPLLISDFSVDGDLLYLAAGDAGLLIVQVEK